MELAAATAGNVAVRLTTTARAMPAAVAVAEPRGHDRAGRRQYRQVSFRELDDDSDRIARGLRKLGLEPGMRIALLVRPGVDFVALVFALFKAGAVIILIDPGMGRRNLIGCLAEAEPQGFVAIPLAQAIRTLLRRRFRRAKLNVTVGRRWFWGGTTLAHLRSGPLPSADDDDSRPAAVARRPDDPAAIIFTSGGTGPPKGVLYSHGNFNAQVDQLRERYDFRPGEIDVPCFPLFGLFNAALGVTTVIPDMDPSRPAAVDPRKIVEAIADWQATQTFGSPAVWRRVGEYCAARGVRLPTVRRVLSAGAPVPAEVLKQMAACIHSAGEVFTPYGATEALPVASIGSAEVLAETAAKTRDGAGVCVGRRFSGIEWRVIRAVDGPLATIADAEPLSPGQIGELIVRGPVVTSRYVTRPEANVLAKIADGPTFWHRMGDVGHLDGQDRFWMCGRLVQRVTAAAGPMYTIPCEAVFNEHPAVSRSALVGVGPPGGQRPVIVVELRPGAAGRGRQGWAALAAELRGLAAGHPHTAAIQDFLLYPRRFPVDVRHNVKIARDKLAAWAAGKIGRGGP
jgi:acyl-CoA synthetase (AMP-forming)/AMP-acid ligase II